MPAAERPASPFVSCQGWLHRVRLLVALTLVGLLYIGTFHTPWIYDDIDGIPSNPALSAGATFAEIFTASPPDSTPYGRPVVVLSLALNRAVGSFEPVGYRVFNLVVHLGSALLIGGLVRRVLLRCSGGDVERAARVAGWAAVLFAVNPLATTVVTYTVQRAEGLMAFFYLATLAAAARALAEPGRCLWPWLAVGLCGAGMATKETMVTAPLAVLLLHRCAFAGSWREVAAKWGFYLGLVATWAVLAGCMLAWPRSQSVGFASEGMGALDYLNIQTGAWWHYLGLVFAPWRTAIDYWPSPAPGGVALARGLGFAVVYVGVAVWTWRRSRVLAAGLLLPGLVLLPTSTVVPIFTSPVADHRMYLPVAFGLAVLVAGIFSLVGARKWLAAVILAGVVGGLAGGTVAINRVYRSERAVWENAIARDPGNARAQNNLGLALAEEGRADLAEVRFREALRLRAGYADAWYNLGTIQGADGRLASAEESFRRALFLRPVYAAAHCNLAVVLARRGRRSEAVTHYEEALRIRPDYPAANFNLAVVYFEAGEFARALPLARACVWAAPDYPRARELVADISSRIR